MNLKHVDEYLSLIEAAAKGLTLQYRDHLHAPWRDITHCDFSKDPIHYRIKVVEKTVQKMVWYNPVTENSVKVSDTNPNTTYWESVGYKKAFAVFTYKE